MSIFVEGIQLPSPPRPATTLTVRVEHDGSTDAIQAAGYLLEELEEEIHALLAQRPDVRVVVAEDEARLQWTRGGEVRTTITDL